MTKSLPVLILSTAALLTAGAASAQGMTPTHKTQAKTIVATKTTTTTRPSAAPAAKATTRTTTTRQTAANGRMVTTKTATGKTVTYNCSKAGNANKKACK